MALVTVGGHGLLYPRCSFISTPSMSATAVGPIDAAGEKAAFCGRVWFPTRTGTKDIRYVCFRFGTVVKTGGSTLTASLQDVSLTSGPPMQPDETQDQTVAIANADAGFASNTWYKTAALSADRTVTYGDRLAFVVEFNSFQAGDSFHLSGVASVEPYVQLDVSSVQKIAAPAWAAIVNKPPNVIFEFSDGTFGTLDGAFPASAINAHTANVDTGTADEFALNFQVPFPCKVDGLAAMVSANAATSDFEILLYSDTTALATVGVDANAVYASAGVRYLLVPIPEISLSKDTLYRVAIRPTVTGVGGNVGCYSIDVADANHFSVHDGGINLQYSTRLDQGAWSAATATRRLLAGVRICELDDGVSAGGGRPELRGGNL